MFRDKYKRDMRDERDKELFIELKKEFLEQNNLSQDLVDDFYATYVSRMDLKTKVIYFYFKF